MREMRGLEHKPSSLAAKALVAKPAHVFHARPMTSNATRMGARGEPNLTAVQIAASIQRMSTVSSPGDAFEREADAVADHVLRMAEPASLAAAPPSIQRKCSACEGEEKEKLQTKPPRLTHAGALDTDAAANAIGHGAPLSPEMRSYFEPRFGHDFSQVRVHTDGAAALAVQARAYTYGRDIVFGSGEYAPASGAGRRLLAHELTHVVQQGAAPATSVSTAAPNAGTIPRSAPQIQRAAITGDKPVESDDTLLACLLLAPRRLKPLCYRLTKQVRPRAPASSDSKTPAPTPAPAPGVSPPQPPPPTLPFFHGSTWAIAQTIPGYVETVKGGGDFGRGFYTHHNAANTDVAAERARMEGCRLCQKMSPTVRYAGVIRFDVAGDEYKKLFTSRKTFGLTSTKQSDYAARQKDWLDFVSGKGRGRQADPTYDSAHMSWRHQRVSPEPNKPAPDQGFDLVEGPMYKGVEGLPGSSVPARSKFDPYEKDTTLPQQVVWNHERAEAVLNGAKTTLTQFDAQHDCKRVDPPVAVKPAKSTLEESRAREEAQIGMTGH